ncbi:alpha/beta fold hydrolase [Arthrobacter sp. KNU-44]|uniref:alpha/beta fold hydrolase n=1 Tax=Arthrobacter sp. KNU-44 TaxID=3450744 RepID=UPI003F437118
MLLLHAWGESRRSFDRLVPLLKDFRVYAPDLRGQGDAEKPGLGYSLADQAEDAAAILDALGVQRAFILGSSSGGYVAQQLAIGYPDRVAALVLVGSPLSLRGRTAFANEVARSSGPRRRELGTEFPCMVPTTACDSCLVYRGPGARRSQDACACVEAHPRWLACGDSAHGVRNHSGAHPDLVGRT